MRRWRVTQVQRVREQVEVEADTVAQALTEARRRLPTITGLNRAHVETEEMQAVLIEGERERECMARHKISEVSTAYCSKPIGHKGKHGIGGRDSTAFEWDDPGAG